MAVAAIETSQSLITWRYLWWALTAIAGMIAAIVAGNLWLLNFIHVFSSLLWTGVDLFMGFVLGPILRRVDLSVRREIVRRLTPRTLFLMPTVSIIFGHNGLVPRSRSRLQRAGMAGLWLGGRGTGAGYVDDHPGPRFLDAGECVRLSRIAEGRARLAHDQYLDATIFLCRRAAGHDAGCDHRGHDALPDRRLNRATDGLDNRNVIYLTCREAQTSRPPSPRSQSSRPGASALS
jgi:hypothetical protein